MLLPVLVVAAVAAGPPSLRVRAGDEAERKVRIEQAIDVAPVWSGHYVDFALLTHDRQQLFNSRREAQGWRIYQTSDWRYRWDLRGTGSIVFEVFFGPVTVDRRGNLTQSYRHVKYGSGLWRLDEATLKPVGPADLAAQPDPMPPELNDVQSREPMMTAAFASDLGRADEPGVRYLLRWEARPENRDRPYPGEPPKPSMLRVYQMKLP